MKTPVDDPFTRDELARDLGALRRWSDAFWGQFATDEFFAPLGTAWSPADNVRHLVKSNRPVAMALRLPQLVLLLRFGLTNGRSRRYGELVAFYRSKLATGFTSGRFTPRPLAASERTSEQRERALADLAASLDAVAAPLAGWSERALDRLRLPHPAMGKLTVREILFFTVYHQTHHAANVERLRGGTICSPRAPPAEAGGAPAPRLGAAARRQ